jgi:RNA polymerase sigma factor (sigma-70 family)
MTTDASAQLSPSEATPEQRFLNYARTGDKAIVQALIQEYANRSYNQARRIIGRDDGAEDAVQEAYLLLVRTADRYTGDVPFAAWLGRLVGSSAINYRQRMHRDRNLSDMSDGGAAAMNDQSGKPSTEESPEIEAVRTALDSLPDKYRAPLTLYYFGGMNQDETAQALRSPSGTVASQLARGLELLRQKLGRAGFAVTSAGLLSMFASIPTYAAPPALTANLAAMGSAQFAAASRQVGENILGAKKASFLHGIGLVKTGAIAAAIAAVAITAGVYQDAAHAPVQFAAEPESGLIAHWSFDEGKGSLARSSIGDDQVGTLVNAPKWMPGKTGTALAFDGATQYVRTHGSPGFNGIKNRVTVAAWVFKSAATADYGGIVGRRTGSDYADLWTLLYGLDSNDNYSFLTTTTLGGYTISGPSSVTDLNAWVHIAGVYDGAQMRLYRNGVLVGSGPCSGDFAEETSPVMIGASDRGIYGVGEFAQAGIDEVRIYNRALTASEIADLAR